VIDIGFESSWCVPQPEWQESVLELPIPSAECRCVHIARLDQDEGIGVCEVQLCDDPGSAQPVEHLRDLWQRVYVLHSGLIQSFVLETQPQCTVLLRCKQYW